MSFVWHRSPHTDRLITMHIFTWVVSMRWFVAMLNKINSIQPFCIIELCNDNVRDFSTFRSYFLSRLNTKQYAATLDTDCPNL